MNNRTWTEEQLIEAVKSSKSLRQVLTNLKLREAGGNYESIKWWIAKLVLDTAHFSGYGHLKGKTHNWAKKRDLQDILKENTKYSSNRLKKRLIKEGTLEEKCYKCLGSKWLDEKMPLELEHINGNKFDNRIENLTLLCPNCHAQTTTYRGKNKTRYREPEIKIIEKQSLTKNEKELKICIGCGKEYSGVGLKYCSYACSHLASQRVIRPSVEQIKEELKTSNFSALGRKYGVSDNTIRKWIK